MASMATISPGRISRSMVAPTMSSAQVSEANTTLSATAHDQRSPAVRITRYHDRFVEHHEQAVRALHALQRLGDARSGRLAGWRGRCDAR
jgi:hypothetical protein